MDIISKHDNNKADTSLLRIGKIIKRRRSELKLTQEDVALSCNIQTQYLSQIERGIGNPTFDKLKKIAETFDCSVEGLFNGKYTTQREIKESEIADILNNCSDKELEMLTQTIKSQLKIFRTYT